MNSLSRTSSALYCKKCADNGVVSEIYYDRDKKSLFCSEHGDARKKEFLLALYQDCGFEK